MTSSTPPLSLFLTAADVCALLGLKKSRIYELAAAELLPVVRLGRKVLFSRRGILAMDEQAVSRALGNQRAA